MMERQACGLCEALAVRRVPRAQLVAAGLADGRGVVGQELHLLGEAALDDRVVLVDAETERLAIEDLLADAGRHQVAQLLRCRRTLPLRRPRRAQLPEIAL